MAKPNNAIPAPAPAAADTFDIMPPVVGIKLDVTAADLATVGIVALRNALTKRLAAEVAAISSFESQATELRGRRDLAVQQQDELEFNKLVDEADEKIRDWFGLIHDDVPGLTVSKSVVSYSLRSGRMLSATLSYKSADGRRSATMTELRSYPTPQPIADLEAKIADLEARKAAADKMARSIRVQIQDKEALREQVQSALTRRMLQHADVTGRAMLAALVDGVEDAESPILALLDNRDAK